MKWIGRRKSSNVDDRRKIPGGNRTILGGAGIGIVIALIMYFKNGDTTLLQQEIGKIANNGISQKTSNQVNDSVDDQLAEFVKVNFADNEDVWHAIFKENNLSYREPTLVLFRTSTTSGCGDASSATGPFYCPADEKIYIDLSFFEELKNKFGAKGGDFAISYVLAHEVGHHVQHLLGVSTKVNQLEQQLPKNEANKYSVALELQADFYAGVWAHKTHVQNNSLEEGDMEEALSAASAVGDDRIQQKANGYVVPDAFTHGSSQQRMEWFKKGFTTGDINSGNTFSSFKLKI